jgi:gluconolactonase
VQPIPIDLSDEELSMSIRSRVTCAAALFFAALALACGSHANAADAPATKTIKAGELSLTVPEAWEKQPVRSQFRKAQMKVPDVAGDKDETDFVVYYFDGGGGGIDPNVQRWVGSFLPTGRKLKVTSGKSSQGDYVFVDLQGTWKKPIGPMVQQKTEEMPNSRALSVILTTKEGNYYLRLTGPEKTVSANADAFRATFGADAKTEKDRPLARE